MGFNKDKFNKADFVHRKALVKVPELKDFFDKDDKPVWEVRGLTGEELLKANDAIKQNKMMEELIEKYASDNKVDQIEAIKASMGLNDEVSDDMVKAINYVKMGSVNPECTHEMAVRLSNANFMAMTKLFKKINELSGMGMQLGESKPSTGTTE